MNDEIAPIEREHGTAIPEAGMFGRIIDRGGVIFAIGILVAMLILIQEVILRYVFNAPTNWAHETTIFLSGIAFVYGGLYCAARDRHIRVVLIYDALPYRFRRVLDVAISIVCAIASTFFAWAAWLMVERAAFTPAGEFRLERSGSAWDPVYPGLMKVFLLLVMAALAIQFVILAYNYAKGQK
ncbi:TRAP-type C4-dicarboxylate transport system, small permease component [Poseidonocella pacifica]|uniref:TRAP transporter small permease protein n=1 Tax=Poseidonocella pacifica TaxID=871651 RepID=A0A1I0X7Q2_9RHOB|nr:TRAP transporter small permease [Poseidonocella pacifica]SFA96358.1 TRAP-type C4-dicarboxylate transport system, small permease component [Poseidonocella pacifica]